MPIEHTQCSSARVTCIYTAGFARVIGALYHPDRTYSDWTVKFVPRLPADSRISLKKRGGRANVPHRTRSAASETEVMGPTERQVLDQSARSHCDTDRRAHPALAGCEHLSHMAVLGNVRLSSGFHVEGQE